MKIPVINNSTSDLVNEDHIFALGAEANIFIQLLNQALAWVGWVN